MMVPSSEVNAEIPVAAAASIPSEVTCSVSACCTFVTTAVRPEVLPALG